MNDLTVFQNPEFGELRTAEQNGETWFCLADICKPLGIRAKDCRHRLKAEGIVIIDTPTNRSVQGMLFVNEGNLYRAIFQSHKPEADRFTDWVTEEVLPSIRKTGRYENRPMTVAENLAAQAQLLVEQEKRIERIEQRVETALTAIARPSADTWVPDMAEAMQRYCEAKGLSVPAGKGRLYAMLDREANCSTDARLRRLRARQKEIGKRYKDYMALTKLDAIAADKKLRVAFEGIVARETARVAKE
nr:MAG TPA: repressor domain protein [Bacteriophage sp.]